MFIIFPVVCAVLLVTVGYFALWTSVSANTPKGVSAFGMIVATILYVVAAIVLIGGLVYGPNMHMAMMHRMAGWGGLMEMKEMQEGCGMEGMMEENMSKEQPGAMKEKMQEPLKKGMLKK